MAAAPPGGASSPITTPPLRAAFGDGVDSTLMAALRRSFMTRQPARGARAADPHRSGHRDHRGGRRDRARDGESAPSPRRRGTAPGSSTKANTRDQCNGGHPMNEHDDVMCQVRESFSGLRMDMPVEKVFARSRARRRRRLSGLTAAAAATAGAAAAITLTHAADPPPRSVTATRRDRGRVRLTRRQQAWVPRQARRVLGDQWPRRQHHADPAQRPAVPAGPRRASPGPGAARHTGPGHRRHLLPIHAWRIAASLGQVVHPSNPADGSAMVIDGQAMPSRTRLSIGYFQQGHVRTWRSCRGRYSPSHAAALPISPRCTSPLREPRYGS